jgi:hypothetical protein
MEGEGGGNVMKVHPSIHLNEDIDGNPTIIPQELM